MNTQVDPKESQPKELEKVKQPEKHTDTKEVWKPYKKGFEINEKGQLRTVA